MKKVLAAALSALMLLSLAACGGKKNEAPQSKIDQIKAAGVLTIGTSADYPPAEFHKEIDGKDTIVGYDISIAQYIAEDLGVDLKIVDMAFDSLCISLKQGEFDLVLAAMSETEERAQSVDFTAPYYTGDQKILIRVADEALYSTKEDLPGHTVAIQRGTIQEPLAIEYFGEKNVVGLVKNQDIIMELQHGKVDVAFIDAIVASAYASANDDLMVKDVGLGVQTEGQAIALQKGNDDFKEYLDEVIAKLLADGTIEQYMAEAQLLAGIEE